MDINKYGVLLLVYFIILNCTNSTSQRGGRDSVSMLEQSENTSLIFNEINEEFIGQEVSGQENKQIVEKLLLASENYVEKPILLDKYLDLNIHWKARIL